MIKLGPALRAGQEKKRGDSDEMPSIADDKRYREGLMQDLAMAQEQAASGARSRGGPVESDFAPRALRINNRAFAQKELADASAAIDKTVKALVMESGLKDEVEAGRMEHGLKQKLNQVRLYMMKRSGEFNVAMERKGMAQEERAAMLSGIANMARGMTETITLGIKRRKDLERNGGGGGGSGIQDYDADS